MYIWNYLVAIDQIGQKQSDPHPFSPACSGVINPTVSPNIEPAVGISTCIILDKLLLRRPKFKQAGGRGAETRVTKSRGRYIYSPYIYICRPGLKELPLQGNAKGITSTAGKTKDNFPCYRIT